MAIHSSIILTSHLVTVVNFGPGFRNFKPRVINYLRLATPSGNTQPLLPCCHIDPNYLTFTAMIHYLSDKVLVSAGLLYLCPIIPRRNANEMKPFLHMEQNDSILKKMLSFAIIWVQACSESIYSIYTDVKALTAE